MLEGDIASFLNRAVKGTALVADATRISRLLLGKILGDIGYKVIFAENGREAITLFKQQHIDIVFMDVFMSEVTGYQAAAEMKQISPRQFTPILFVTAETDVESLVKCIACGGDDILFKPVHQSVLKAKVLGFERTKAIYNEISQLHSQRQEEEELAERVFSSAVSNSLCADRELLISLNSASTFSGDVVFAEYRPNGDINFLLGDFTGHGLRAAIGAMPVADIFRGMTRKGYSAEAILQQINKRLFRLLPTGMFMAGILVEASLQQQSLRVWNGGMPELLIFNNQQRDIRERVISESLPLGIQVNLEFELKQLQWLIGDHVLLLSDGVTEAVNEEQQMFGPQRLEQAILDKRHQASYIASIQEQLHAFCQNAPQLDDISMVELPDLLSRPSSLEENSNANITVHKGCWSWRLSLDADSLKTLMPIPLLMTSLQELSVNHADRNILFTVVSELYNNAYEHGVLKLESSLKDSADGFENYYLQRKLRADELELGWVKISISYDGKVNREFTIVVEDSGAGFDQLKLSQQAKPQQYSGRGLLLVESLCESLEILENGSVLKVVYRCQY